MVMGCSMSWARKPATAEVKAPISMQMSARCFAQIRCSSRLHSSGAQAHLAAESRTRVLRPAHHVVHFAEQLGRSIRLGNEVAVVRDFLFSGP
jgi:hypothetical protein